MGLLIKFTISFSLSSNKILFIMSNIIIFLTYKIISSLLYKKTFALSLRLFFNFNWPLRQLLNIKLIIISNTLKENLAFFSLFFIFFDSFFVSFLSIFAPLSLSIIVFVFFKLKILLLVFNCLFVASSLELSLFSLVKIIKVFLFSLLL